MKIYLKIYLKIFFLSLIIGPTFCPPPLSQAHPYPGAIFLKIESLHPWVRRKVSTKNKVDCLNSC